jgi:hypothetical protein
VGSALYLEVSAKQAVGIALLGIAFSWLVGSLTPRILTVAFAIVTCAVGLYVATAPVWSDWNSTQKAAAEYDDAIAELQSAVKSAAPALQIVSSTPIPTGATTKGEIKFDWSRFQPIDGAGNPKGQPIDAVNPSRTVTIPDPVKSWIRPEKRSEGDKRHMFPEDVSDGQIMKALEDYLLLPGPTFSRIYGSCSCMAGVWWFCTFHFRPVDLGLVVTSNTKSLSARKYNASMNGDPTEQIRQLVQEEVAPELKAINQTLTSMNSTLTRILDSMATFRGEVHKDLEECQELIRRR